MHPETVTGVPNARFIFFLLLIAAVGMVVAFGAMPGTEDMPIFWVRWAELVSEHGLRAAYREALTDYPPGVFFIYALANVMFGAVAPFVLVKGMIVLAVLAGALIYFSWSQSLSWTVALLFAVLLSSVILAYVDVLYLAPLFASLWALQRARVAFASFCFTLPIVLKWQPLILAPFFVLHATGFSLERWRDFRAWSPRLAHVALGAALPIVLCLALVDPAMLARAFSLASSHHALSFQALNANWLVELGLYARHGAAQVYDVPVPAGLATAVRVLFFACFGFVLLLFSARARRFDEFLWFACLGFLTYFLLNLGVHENHFFVPMTLAFLLPCAGRAQSQPVVIFLAVMANVNLLLFYGLEGAKIFRGQNMLIASGIFALVNVAFGIACLVPLFKHYGADLRQILAPRARSPQAASP
jgi:hypothetical protein